MDDGFQESKARLICLICRQAQTVAGLTTVLLERGEMRLGVKHVPAQVCPGCGEAYVEQQVAVWLLREAEEMFAAGELDGVIEYEHQTRLLDSSTPK